MVTLVTAFHANQRPSNIETQNLMVGTCVPPAQTFSGQSNISTLKPSLQRAGTDTLTADQRTRISGVSKTSLSGMTQRSSITSMGSGGLNNTVGLSPPAGLVSPLMKGSPTENMSTAVPTSSRRSIASATSITGSCFSSGATVSRGSRGSVSSSSSIGTVDLARLQNIQKPQITPVQKLQAKPLQKFSLVPEPHVAADDGFITVAKPKKKEKKDVPAASIIKPSWNIEPARTITYSNFYVDDGGDDYYLQKGQRHNFTKEQKSGFRNHKEAIRIREVSHKRAVQAGKARGWIDSNGDCMF